MSKEKLPTAEEMFRKSQSEDPLLFQYDGCGDVVSVTTAISITEEHTRLHTAKLFCRVRELEEKHNDLIEEVETGVPEATRIIEELKAENERLREALEMLVELKEIKDLQGKTQYYEENQPIAWEKAKEALKNK